MSLERSPEEGGAALSGVVVHWNDEDGLRRLLDAWPRDGRFPLVVVDNSGGLGADSLPSGVIYDDPEANLGFGGGVERGRRTLEAHGVRWRWLLILNPDAVPEPGALEDLLEVAETWRREDPRLVGVAPTLRDPDGSGQHRWQLQPLPSPGTLIAQVFFLGGERGPKERPLEGAEVEQPAAAVLALHRAALDGRGILFDPGYFPAWFDDVDLARRLKDRGLRLRYTRRAAFAHARGGSVPALGYGRFLFIYYRNLVRYLRLHHGAGWALLARLVLPLSLSLRVLLLPLRKPRRAASRSQAARDLMGVALGALSGWRAPAAWARAGEDR
ncbi:MAG: glycosyltransferase family 2 protein [Acidobacteriota bacterium]